MLRRTTALCLMMHRAASTHAYSGLPPLVTPSALLASDNLSSVKFVDASWHLGQPQRVPRDEFAACRLPGACYFDIDEVADKASSLPHMLPSAEGFALACGGLGLARGDDVVVYNADGACSAARCWWTFKCFGHPKVRVLDGGLGAWRAAGGPTDASPAFAAVPPPRTTTYEGACLDPALVVGKDQVLAALSAEASRKPTVLDARPWARFAGEAPEPRPGLRRGHVPGATSLPAAAVLQAGDLASFQPAGEAAAAFEAAGVTFDRPVITTCGSGVTAAVLTLALHNAYPEQPIAPVYDGSFAEWGDPKNDLPLEISP